MTRQWRVGLLLAAMAVAAPVWADDSNKATPDPDPWQGFNRKMYGFNDTLDVYALRPVASAYRRVTPNFLMDGVSNFFNNLHEPISVVNLLLQGKVRGAVSDTGRFLLNSTVGLLGFIDVAGRAQIPSHREDFGLTLGTWGVGPGPYLVVPFFGPSTVRDITGRGVDFYDNPDPLTYNFSLEKDVIFFAAEGISDRAALIPLEGIIQGDKYLFMRDSYLQHRQFELDDGKQAADPFLDDSGGDDSSDGSTTSAPAAPQGASPGGAPGANITPAADVSPLASAVGESSASIVASGVTATQAAIATAPTVPAGATGADVGADVATKTDSGATH